MESGGRSLAGGVWSKGRIQTAMMADPAERLIITPLLDEGQIGDASVDLRLGYDFVLARPTNIAVVDPFPHEGADLENELEQFHKAEVERRRYQEKIRLGPTGVLHLHPREFVLGGSLEYLRLPTNAAAYVTSRSSWGRMGLVIATAIAVAPGFRGVITLELTNLGRAPLKLRPGVRIAQVVLHDATPGGMYSGRYNCPTEPEFGRIHLDEELRFWSRAAQ